MKAIQAFARVSATLTGMILVMFGLVAPSTARADDCEALGLTGATREELEAYIDAATTTFDIGLLLAGGVRHRTAIVGADVNPIFHMALSGGFTYAIGMDLDTYCNDLDAPLPPGLGWQIFAATNNFEELEAGAFARYHGELNLASPDILLELGGLFRWIDGEDAPGVLASIGYGTQAIQVLTQGQYIFDEAGTLIAILGVRLDAFFFELLFS